MNRSVNQCSYCGLFQSWEKLTLQFTPDTHYSSEDSFYVCDKCYNKEKAQEIRDARYKQDQEWLRKKVGPLFDE